MALILKLGTLLDGKYEATFSTEGDKAYVADSTGNYDAGTNPGGYGAPNPDRNQIGWVNLVVYKALTADEVITAESYDGLAAIQITIPLTKDGHIQVDGWLLPIIVGGEAEGTFAYDTTDGKTKKLTSAVWVEVTDLTDLYADTSLVRDTLNIPVLVAASKKRNEINKERFDKILGGEYNETRDALDRLYLNVDGRMDQASYQFNAGNFYNFQRIVEALNKFIAEFGV